MKTAQEVFDIMVNGVIRQGGRSATPEGSCLYVNPVNSRRCAMGQLIPAELYDPVIEGFSISSFRTAQRDLDEGEGSKAYKATRAAMARIWESIPELAEHYRLVSDIQEIHDREASGNVEIFKTHIRTFANLSGLEVPELAREVEYV